MLDLHIDEVVGLNELRKRYSVTHRQISAWSKRGTGGFPDPVAMTIRALYPGGRPRSPMYVVSEVDEWIANYSPNGFRGLHWGHKRDSARLGADRSTSSRE